MKYDMVKLKELCTVNQGLQIPISKRYKEPGDNRFFYITVQFLKESGENYYIENPPKSVTCTKDEILVVRTGNTGQVITGVTGCFHNNFFKVTPNERVFSRYLYYALNNKKMHDAMLNAASGTTIPDLKHSSFYDLEIPLPSIDIQKKISTILDNICNKLKLNSEINNNLQELSKQLLLKYLEDNDESEEINISELLNVFTGKKNANETSLNGKYKFFSCAPESLLSDTYLYDGAAIIVAGNGAYTGRTRFYDGKFELYQRTYGLTLKDGINKNNIYGLYVFMKTVFEPDKMGGTHGSAIPYIVLSDLTDYKLKYNKSEFDKFSDLVSSNIKMIQENEKSSEELSQLRDTLLPKLMNGEIDLNNIEI